MFFKLQRIIARLNVALSSHSPAVDTDLSKRPFYLWKFDKEDYYFREFFWKTNAMDFHRLCRFTIHTLNYLQ